MNQDIVRVTRGDWQNVPTCTFVQKCKNQLNWPWEFFLDLDFQIGWSLLQSDSFDLQPAFSNLNVLHVLCSRLYFISDRPRDYKHLKYNLIVLFYIFIYRYYGYVIEWCSIGFYGLSTAHDELYRKPNSSLKLAIRDHNQVLNDRMGRCNLWNRSLSSPTIWQ